MLTNCYSITGITFVQNILIIPSTSLSLALHQVSLCSVVNTPTGCSALVGELCTILCNCSSMC